MFMLVHSEFKGEAELARCRLEILEDMTKKALDNLLFLLLGRNAHLKIFGRSYGFYNTIGLRTTSVSCQVVMVYLPVESNQSARSSGLGW